MRKLLLTAPFIGRLFLCGGGHEVDLARAGVAGAPQLSRANNNTHTHGNRRTSALF
jgi:hypothetical protein